MILEIDPQGAFQVKEKMPEAILVFIAPPSLEVLEERLRGRGTEDETSMKRRLVNAVGEMEYASSYDKVIVNDDLDTAAEELFELISK